MRDNIDKTSLLQR